MNLIKIQYKFAIHEQRLIIILTPRNAVICESGTKYFVNFNFFVNIDFDGIYFQIRWIEIYILCFASLFLYIFLAYFVKRVQIVKIPRSPRKKRPRDPL